MQNLIENITVNFDSGDWNSIRAMIDHVNKVGMMLKGETAEGETIVFDVFIDEDGNENLMTTTYQNNHWIRKNYYYVDDYVIETLFDGRW